MEKYCIMCGSSLKETDKFCINCGSNQITTKEEKTKIEGKSKVVAGILGITLGWLGIHNFYLGNASRGVIQIIITIVTCSIGGLWGITEGVLILLGYITEDANGMPLE